MAQSRAKKIQVRYYALLREERGLKEETVTTSANSVKELYESLRKKHGFRLDTEFLKVAINEEFMEWNTPLKTGDSVVFVPPVAGG